MANIAVNGFRREAAFRARLPRIESLYRKVQADPLEQAFSAIMLERCWQVIEGLPERQHAVALLRWGLDMKQNEIAAVLNMTEKTVSVHLCRVRHKLLSQLYQQITEAQAPRFGIGYDLEKGLERYRAWLSAHAGPNGHATEPEGDG